jgi:hypothetical protein
MTESKQTHKEVIDNFLDKNREVFNELVRRMEAAVVPVREPITYRSMILRSSFGEDILNFNCHNRVLSIRGPIDPEFDNYSFLEDRTDHSHVYNIPKNSSEITTNHYPDRQADIKGYLDRSLITASEEFNGLSAWKATFDSMPLVRNDVFVAHVDNLPDNSHWFEGAIELPLFRDDAAMKKLVESELTSQRTLIDRAASSGVYEYLENEADKSRPAIARDGKFGIQKTEKYGPLLSMAEAITTEAQLISLLAADSPCPINIPKLICDLARKNVFDRIALCMPAGIIGPFATRGITIKDGAIEIIDGTYCLKPEFEACLVKRSNKRKKRIATIALRDQIEDKRYESDYERINRLREVSEHTFGLGCPIVAKPEAGQTTPIDFTLQLLVNSVS